MRIAYYISAHGFGHATRAVEVINQFPEAVEIEVVSAVPGWLLHKSIRRSFTHRVLSHDSGILQPDSFTQDIPGTIRRWNEVLDAYPAMARDEANTLQQSGTRLVVADISPFGVAVARQAGVPCVVVGNFSWDWILAGFVERFPAMQNIIDRIAALYAQTDLLLRTPLSDGMDVFPHTVMIPLIARKALYARSEVRQQLGVEEDQPLALASFGGFGFDRLGPELFERYTDWTFLAMKASMTGARNVIPIDPQACYHPDLVEAADVVIAKLGYGVVTECIAHRTPIAHPPREGFPEHEILARETKQWIPLMAISEDDFLGGRWPFLQEAAWRDASTLPEADCSGGEAAARILMERFLY